MPTATVVFAALLAAAKTTKPSAGSTALSYVFLFIVIGVVFFWFRSRQTNARRTRDTLMDLSAGDEVLTGAGIFGTVLDVEPDRVTLETAPGTRITVVRSTIARRITEPDRNSVAEQNWHDEAHDGVAQAAAWHDPNEHDPDEHDPDGDGLDRHGTDGHEQLGQEPVDHDAMKDEPEADGAPGTGQGGGR
jgi:preprotein translocase subunit YajC